MPIKKLICIFHKIFILLLCIFLIYIFNVNININANAKNDIYVKPILSGLPIMNNSSYFNLKVEPNMHYDICLDVGNNTNKVVFASSLIKNASTSYNGNIIYNNLSKNANMLIHDINGKNLKKYIIKPFTHKIIKYRFYIDKNYIKGSKLGGVITTFDYKNSKKGITNSISYINGIALTEKNIEPNIKSLSIGSFKYSNKDHMYKLLINNFHSVLYRNLSIHLTGVNNSLNKYFQNVNIAPNSSFYLNIPSFKNNISLNDVSVIINDKFNINNHFSDVSINPVITIIFIFMFIMIVFIIKIFRRGK